jgi:cold shock CspA family protein
MTSTPAPETVQFIAKILAARETPQDEVPALIAAVQQGIESLVAPPPVTAIARPAVVPVAAPSPQRRRRGRPRKAEVIPLELPPAPPPAPRLMRRAEMAPRLAEPAAVELRPTTRAAIRGVVKWYDPRTRHGAVRLPGYSGDIAVSPEALERAGIPRLFKGQEIEASISESLGEVSLLTLSLPGRPETDPAGGGPLGSARRNARPVVIEMKKDALRRVAARVEAEQLLGPTPRPPGSA